MLLELQKKFIKNGENNKKRRESDKQIKIRKEALREQDKKMQTIGDTLRSGFKKL